MSNTLQNLLQDALTALTESRFDDVRTMLGKPYKSAMGLPETTQAAKTQAAALYENLYKASSDVAKDRLPLDDIKEYIADAKHTHNGDVWEQLSEVSDDLHFVLHDISEARVEQAEGLTKHEADLLASFSGDGNGLWNKVKGTAQYNWDLTKRRWGGDHRAGAALSDAASEHAHDCGSHAHHGAAEAVAQTTHAVSTCTNPAHNHAGSEVSSATLEGKALEEFGNVGILDTAMKKAGAIALGGLGTGLVVHGVRNAVCAFKEDTNNHLELEELGANTQDKKGVNWTQLAVGTGEVILGGALIHRSATGRWGVAPVEGHAERFFDCSHDHSHGFIGHG